MRISQNNKNWLGAERRHENLHTELLPSYISIYDVPLLEITSKLENIEYLCANKGFNYYHACSHTSDVLTRVCVSFKTHSTKSWHLPPWLAAIIQIYVDATRCQLASPTSYQLAPPLPARPTSAFLVWKDNSSEI